MAQNKKKKIDGDLSEFILLALLKEGILSLKELQEYTALQSISFIGRRQRRHERLNGQVDIAETCEGLVCKKLLKLTDQAKYELTQYGKAKAEETARAMEKGAAILEKQFLSPSATARNTTAGYVVLAVFKLLAGFLSGSVGLIADGADTTIDTAASAVVWFGIKAKKEIFGTILIIGLMFTTAIILFFDSANSVIQNFAGILLPMTIPIVVIAIELFAMMAMFVFSLYQRFVGRRSQSLALISQSIDSKNSVYSSAAVIVGALFSIFGVFWVDAVVGGFIAVRIYMDSFGLSKEVVQSMKGAKTEFSKFKIPFEKQIEQRRMDNFRNWVMYTIHEDNLKTKQEIVGSLEKTFRPSYMPTVFSEFTVGRAFDFENSFPEIVRPLIDRTYLLYNNGSYLITERGKSYIKQAVGNSRYKQREL
jgi:cation diffusion facilitator family transporter